MNRLLQALTVTGVLVAVVSLAGCGLQSAARESSSGGSQGIPQPRDGSPTRNDASAQYLDAAAGEELWILATDARGRSPAENPDRPTDRPGCGALLCRRPGGRVPVPLKHTDVRARIDGIVASVTVQQEFANPFSSKIEAEYLFPLPQDAGITDFLMIIGDRRIRGVVRERAEARRIYEAARGRGKVASLLSQVRPNVFMQRVANIEPGKKLDVSITYWHTIKRAEVWNEWVFPMVVGPRFNPGVSDDGAPTSVPVLGKYLPPDQRSGHDVSLSVDIDAGLPLREVECPSHSIRRTDRGEGRAVIELAARGTIPNCDFVLRWRTDGNALKAALFTSSYDSQNGGHFALMLQPPNGQPDWTRPLDVIFVVDCSGSMKGDPMRNAKAAIDHVLGQLDPKDAFQVIRFSNQASVLGDGLVPATHGNVRRARAEVSCLSADGGTMMLRGLDAALGYDQDSDHERYLVLITDGFIGNEREVLERVGRTRGNARIFSVGIGSAPNRFLLERLARISGGAAAYVGNGDGAGQVMSQFLDRIRRPALTDVTIDWGGLTVSDVTPSRLPPLVTGRSIVVTGRVRGALAATTVRIRGRQDGRPLELQVPVRLATAGRGSALPQIWARARIQDLRERGWCGLVDGDTAGTQIRRLALDYGLLSPFTSFVAVDSMSQTAGSHGTTVPVPVPMPKGTRYDTTVEKR